MSIVIDFNKIVNEDDWQQCQKRIKAKLQSGFQQKPYRGVMQSLPSFLYGLNLEVIPPKTTDYNNLPDNITVAQARQQIEQQQQSRQMYRKHHRIETLLEEFFTKQMIKYIEKVFSVSYRAAEDIFNYCKICNQNYYDTCKSVDYYDTFQSVNGLWDLFNQLRQEGFNLVDNYRKDDSRAHK